MNAPRQQGVALAIVLWFLAGMTLLVSGITYLARVDTQMAQLHRDRAAAVAAGDGAILLMLAAFANRDTSPGEQESTALQGEYRVGDQSVAVVMVPTPGLVNLNSAPAALLERLFSSAARLPAADATALAQSVVGWRERRDPSLPEELGGPLLAAEDLLQVPGMSRALWDVLRDHVVVEGGASGSSPDMALAPESLRAALGKPGAATSGEAGSGAANAQSYRVDALVTTGGRTWLRRKWAILGSGAGGLPWRFSRVEAPRVQAGYRSGY